jgi:5'-3' exonuclease
MVKVLLFRIHKFVKALKDSAFSRDRNGQMGFVKQILQRVKKLRDNGVEPVMVFDGGPLPSKK